MKLIDKLIEPKRLLLVWQSPDDSSKQASGKRFIVGEIIINREKDSKLKYYNNKDVQDACNKGFDGLTAYPHEVGNPDKEYSGNLIDTLSLRLPPSSRGDYSEYLKSFRISPEADGITTMSLLGYTSGKLEGDGFSFIHTFEGAIPPFDFIFEVAGFRHHEGMKLINSLQNAEVLLQAEDDNVQDNEAVLVKYQGDKIIGYVPRGLNSIIRRFMNNTVTAFVTKINGSPNRPNVLIYVEIR